MKILCALMFLIPSATFAQSIDSALIGTWHVIEYNISANGRDVHQDEAKLKADDSKWDIVLNVDGTAEQTTNMVNGLLDTLSGQWTSKGEQLFLYLMDGKIRTDLVYDYTLDDNILAIRRSSQGNKIVVDIKFKMEDPEVIPD